MSLNVSSNRGMYAEEVINRTIDYYFHKQYALIEKRQTPIKIVKKISDSTIVGRIMSKSNVDYFGYYNGKYIEFEVKQTDGDTFSLDLIKQHQWSYMSTLLNFNITPFLIVYMSKYEKFFVLDFSKIQTLKQKNIIGRRISINELNKYSRSMEIIFPGIINFLNVPNL